MHCGSVDVLHEQELANDSPNLKMQNVTPPFQENPQQLERSKAVSVLAYSEQDCLSMHTSWLHGFGSCVGCLAQVQGKYDAVMRWSRRKVRSFFLFVCLGARRYDTT